MTFLAPLWLAVAGAAAAALVALHFFARQRPRPSPLPTARFVPDVAARAPSMTSQPSDLLLLLVRVLAVAAIAVALARPVPGPGRRAVLRVVAVETGRQGTGDSAALDSARALLAPGDTLVRASSLSAALVASLRAASALRDHADSLELVIVSPLGESSFDAATDSIRALWPGRARLVRAGAAALSLPPRIALSGAPDDPLRATIALLGTRTGPEVLIARSTLSASDSLSARSGALVLHWPRDPGTVWPSSVIDTVGAVAAGNAVVVAPFMRNASVPPSPRPSVPPIAHWVDGAPAAFETTEGSGCIRDIAITVPETGDLVLRSSMRELLDELTRPCGDARSGPPAPEARLVALRGSGPALATRLIAAPPRRASMASAWLLALAGALLLGELALRPRVPAA